jgi:hypothetical protein
LKREARYRAKPDTENQLEQIGHQDAILRRPLAASTPNRIFGTQHHVNLARLFRISPIVGLKNCYTRLQEGKVIAMGN